MVMVFYGYEVEYDNGVYLSWNDPNEREYGTPESAREEGTRVLDRWTLQGKSDVTLRVVKVTVEEVDSGI